MVLRHKTSQAVNDVRDAEEAGRRKVHIAPSVLYTPPHNQDDWPTERHRRVQKSPIEDCTTREMGTRLDCRAFYADSLE